MITSRRAFLFVCAASLLQAQSPLTLPLKDGSVRFLAFGDMGTGKPAQYELAQRMVDLRKKYPFNFVILLGDNIYGGKTDDDFRKKFELPYKPLLDGGVQFYASLGNHDDTNERFYKYFGMNGQRYYTFKKGNVRFFALDSDYMDPEQLAWLTQQLATPGPEWKICYFHHPLYSSGKTHGSAVELRQVLEPLFIKYGVDVVFSGHDHVYERVKPQHGIAYFVEGAAGELRVGDLSKTDLTAKGYDTDQSFLALEISGDDLFFQTVSRSGATIDSGTVHRATPVKP